jgi:hypothetical protein
MLEGIVERKESWLHALDDLMVLCGRGEEIRGAPPPGATSTPCTFTNEYDDRSMTMAL